MLCPEVILGHCSVTSTPSTKATPGRKPVQSQRRGRGSAKPVSNAELECELRGKDNSFFCRFALNSMRGTFYDLDWDRHYKQALKASCATPAGDDPDWGTGSEWDVVAETLQNGTPSKTYSTQRSRRKTKVEDCDIVSESEVGGTEDEYQASDAENGSTDDELLLAEGAHDEQSEEEGEESSHAEPHTPTSKKRRRASTTKTPRKARKTIVHPTPHSRRALKARGSPRKGKFNMRAQPLPYVSFDLSHLPQDPWFRAMHVLHVGSRPDALPCREEEFQRVLRCVGELLEEGSGGCICKFYAFIRSSCRGDMAI